MSSSNRVFAHQRNAYPQKTLKRRIDNRCRDFPEEGIRYSPAHKRDRSANPGMNPLYHGSNTSRVCNYGDVIESNSNNCFPFVLHNNDSSEFPNINYQKPFGYENRNPQSVPCPLPYHRLNDDLSFDSLPEWVPNRSNFPIKSSNLVPDQRVRFSSHVPCQSPVITNFPNSIPMNHSDMVSIVSQAMPQQLIVSKDLSDLLNVLNNKNQNSSITEESPLGLDFDSVKLNVRNESVIKSLYGDMPRQCTSCGVRFKCQEDHSNHMDWHVRMNRMAKDTNKTNTRLSQKPKKSRNWFASSSLWLTAATGETIEVDRASQKKNDEEVQQVVPADENQKMCALCIEPFEEFFSHEDDEWMYKDAVYLNMNELGSIVHAKCMPEP